MRTLWLFGLLAALSGACGGSVAPSPAAPAQGDSYGLVFAQITDKLTLDGRAGHVFGADLHAPAPLVDACDGATARTGACCWVPAPPEQPPAGGSTGFAGQTADGSPDYTMPDLGELTLSDATTGGKPERTAYGDQIAGFGYGRGYALQLGGDESWSAGDALVFDASGNGEVPAFHGGATAVDIPTITVPTSVPSSSSLTVTWTPDANASTMTVALDTFATSGEHRGTISCSVDESAGTLTIDASLLARLHPGDRTWGTLTAETRTSIPVGARQVAFAAQGVRGFIVPVE